jgi:hypothetical protein
MFKRNKTIDPNTLFVKNKYDDLPDSDLLNKLREDISELKKLNPKDPCLRHILNDFMIKKEYSRMPNHMKLFEDFFNIVDRDYMNDFSASRNCKIDELD